jgi:hypothetical protein
MSLAEMILALEEMQMLASDKRMFAVSCVAPLLGLLTEFGGISQDRAALSSGTTSAAS